MSRIAITRRAPRILAPYNNLEFQSWFPWLRFGLMAIMVIMVIYASVLASLGGTQLLKVASLPIMVLLGIVVWMLPDVDKHAGAVPKLPNLMPVLVAYIGAIVIWPSYVALVIPGLPWLTPGRLVLAVMLVMLSLHYAQNSQSRATAGAIFGYDKLAIRLWFTYEIMCLVVTPLSRSVADTLTFLVLQETMALSTVLGAVLFLDSERNVKLIYSAVAATCVGTMLIGVLENYMQLPPWAEHIPSFMRIDDEWLARILSPQSRVGDNRYRIRATFPVVLYYSLYLSATLPIVVYSVAKMYKRYPLLSLGVIGLIAHTVWFTNARSAMIALLIPLFLFPAMILLRSFKVGQKVDVMKYAVRGGIILACLGILGGVIGTSHRAQVMVFGGRQHSGSDDARQRQWSNAFEALKSNPIGIGHGNVQDAVGVELRGKRIIDSYWINILVGVGPIGFIAYYGLFARCAWLGMICFLRAKNDIEEYAGAAAIGLVGHSIDQYVISNSDTIYLIMLYCGMILAAKRMQDKRIAEEVRLAAKPSGTGLVPARG